MVKNPERILKWPLAVSVLLIMLNSCQEDFDFPDPNLEGRWEYFTTSSGLPGNNINDIFLDSRGTLWVAFNGAGVASYDGSSWTSYNISNSDILSNNIKCIEEDAMGDMWFGTTNGLSILVDGVEWHDYQDPQKPLNIQTILSDNSGYVWVGTRNNAYFYYDYSSSTYDQSSFTFATLSGDSDLDRVNAIEEDNSGNIWLGTNGGLFKWDWSNWSYQNLDNILETNSVWSLYCDSNNRIWIGTSGGLMAAYTKNNNITLVETLNGGLPVYITDIFEDRDGDIWFTTWFDGVIRHNGIYSEIFRENNGFPDEYVEAVAADNEGNIWIGTSSEGLAKYILPINPKF